MLLLISDVEDVCEDEVGAIGRIPDRANKYFEQQGLTLVDTIAHLHGKGGFAEIIVSGGKLVGKAEYDSKEALSELTRKAVDQFGFETASFALHFHATVGHVDVTVSNEITCSKSRSTAQNMTIR